MEEAYIYDVLRSPFGRYAGAIAGVRPDDLMAKVITDLLARNNFSVEDIEDVIIGDANQAGEDGRNVARFASLLSGIPYNTAGITVNRLCGSGMAAVLDAARTIRCGEGELFIAGGVESMSRAPFAVAKAETAYGRPLQMYDTTLGMRFPNPAYVKQYGDETLIQTADNVAAAFDIGRDESDRYAYNSQQKYAAALADGFYADEITPINIYNRKKKTTVPVEQDEHPRPESTLEKLGTLKPMTEGGVVTAASASGINDGAAGLIVGSKEIGNKVGAKPRARILGGAVAGVEPRFMGMGPVSATEKVLARTGFTLKDMDVVELNEAFAPQVLGCCKQLGLDADDSRLNANGGAIAVGHPLGASGARITLTALRQLEKSGGRYALATMCIGVGQGIAVVIEKV